MNGQCSYSFEPWLSIFWRSHHFSVEWKSKVGQIQSRRIFSKEALLEHFENYISYDTRNGIGNDISKVGEDVTKTKQCGDREDGKDLFKDQGNSLAHRCLNGAWQKQSCL